MMYLYEDYYNYKSGIYVHNKEYNITKGEHSIAIMGWGVENGVKYWLIQDSYGKSKGENGFIRVKIGDDCGAGQTAFCDQFEGKDYEDSTTNITVENTNNMNKDTTINTNQMSEDITEGNTNIMSEDIAGEDTDNNDEPVIINVNKGDYINILVKVKYFMIFNFISFFIF